jgi:prolyl-tRNA editing enzyme YbaK/EbsC (Cys-tRNA(Pro) deacylase)
VGAISPIQFLGKARFYLDQTVLGEEYIDISSGSPDAGLELKTRDLIDLIKPVICDIISNNGKILHQAGYIN